MSARTLGIDQHRPQSAQNQASYGVSNFADGSGHIFSMYLEMATEEDKKMVENWKADADGTLIFVRIYHLIFGSFRLIHDRPVYSPLPSHR